VRFITRRFFFFRLSQIELDEKWFKKLPKLTTRRRRREIDPVLPAEKVHHKEHIEQLMFLSAVGVPQQGPNEGDGYSNGKIGIIPLAELVPAKKSSINRPAGTLEVKPVNVTADYFYDVMTRTGGMLEMVKKVSNL
jgi:hypothetical protein